MKVSELIEGVRPRKRRRGGGTDGRTTQGRITAMDVNAKPAHPQLDPNILRSTQPTSATLSAPGWGGEDELNPVTGKPYIDPIEYARGKVVMEPTLLQQIQAIKDKWGVTDDTEQEEWHVNHTGENTDKSVAELEHEKASAKRRHDVTAERQKNFAIMAKRHWK